MLIMRTEVGSDQRVSLLMFKNMYQVEWEFNRNSLHILNIDFYISAMSHFSL
jgi:hypothetical protein